MDAKYINSRPVHLHLFIKAMTYWPCIYYFLTETQQFRSSSFKYWFWKKELNRTNAPQHALLLLHATNYAVSLLTVYCSSALRAHCCAINPLYFTSFGISVTANNAFLCTAIN